MAESGHGMAPKGTDIICYLIVFLVIVLLAAWMILPRWIPRDNPEGVYDARIWLMNCLCDDGRAFLVVTNHHTFQAVMSHPAEDFINIEGTWEEKPDDNSLLFVEHALSSAGLEDEMKDKAGYHVKCYWGGLEWTFETAENKYSFWFPRLISEVYCDYYNRYFWLNGAMIAGIILIVTGIIGVLFNIWKTGKLSKQHITNRQKQ